MQLNSRLSLVELPRENRRGVPVVPASFFGIVLGLSGLSGSWRAARTVLDVPFIIGEVLALLSAVVWAILVVCYVLKWIGARKAALREIADPVQCCYVGLVGVATMLVSGGVLPYSHAAAVVLFATGATITLVFAIWRTGGLWHGEREDTGTTAVLYLPAVAGCFVTATVASALGYRWGSLAFGVGLFSWLAIESVLLRRLLLAPRLSPALRPTLGIQLAPPAVGAAAYLSVAHGPPDVFVEAMVGYALMQLFVLIRLLPWIMEKSFAASFWSFTFGATALATAALEIESRGGGSVLPGLSLFTFVVANVIVGLIAIGTVWLATRGRLLGDAPKPMPSAETRT